MILEGHGPAYLWNTMTLLLLFLASISLVVASSSPDAVQNPLHDNDQSSFKSTSGWAFNFSSEAPHYFSSIHGLLQQWPNTFFPNGHAIAPGTIPPFTTLYHGRHGSETPPSPEWLAFDIGMSYGIMGSTQESFMLTYQTTRPVQVLYFDGESATLMGTGRMDAQMLHIYGNVTGPEAGGGYRGLYDEYLRSTGLCNWLQEKRLGGPGWGFEGIVRMNAGFELIWCDFTSPSLRLISHLNVSAPLLPPAPEEADVAGIRSPTKSYFPLPPLPTNTNKAGSPPIPAMPPNWRRNENREPFLPSQAWGWFTSAARHYGSSGLGSRLGEIRVKLIHCGILNYYSPEFKSQAMARAQDEQKSLNLTRDGLWLGPKDQANQNSGRQVALDRLTRRRRAHTLSSITEADAFRMRASSERVLTDIVQGSHTRCSGMDWSIVTGEIVQCYATDLINIQDLLRNGESLSPTNRTSIQNWIAKIRESTHTLLVSFLEYPSNGKVEGVWDEGSALYQQTFSRCKYQHTRLLIPEEGILLGPEEQMLKWAVEETLDGICSVIVTIGFATEKIWATEFNEHRVLEAGDWKAGEEIQKKSRYWTAGIEELMAWLGWASEWARCEETCAWDEVCFIPMWPLVSMGPGPGGPKRRPGYPGYPGHGKAPDHLGILKDRERPPPDDGRGPGGGPPGRRRPGRPGFPAIDETNLWRPKCVKDADIMQRLFGD